MRNDLTDILLPDRLSRRVCTIFALDTAPSTLEELVNAWLKHGCSPRLEDLVRSEPTPHRVETVGHMRFAWCALDAMILAIFEREKIGLQTIDPETGHVIAMSLDPIKQPVCRDRGQTPVLAFGFSSTGFVDLKRSCCPHVNLFESAESYERWRAKEANSVTMPLTIDQAWRLAHRWASAMRSAGVPGQSCDGVRNRDGT